MEESSGEDPLEQSSAASVFPDKTKRLSAHRLALPEASHTSVSRSEYAQSRMNLDTTCHAAIDHAQPTSDEHNISFREVEPVDILVDHLSLSVDTGPSALEATFKRQRKTKPETIKTILDDVSAEFRAGTVTAILGASGSGKTSMLNVMSRRMHGRRIDIKGRMTFNGNDNLESVRSAYVMQHDCLLPSLTVRETLHYSAALRLPQSVTSEERARVVEEVILELGLKEAANTRIGNSAHRGCSGGERRRTSIGVQLLANPSVLFLDEPTTGLDATSAYQLGRTLKSLAKKGRTIITTIHQPRSEIWSLFDSVVLLTKGSPAFSGSAGNCLEYFTSLGYPLPPFVNPAEHLIDVCAIDVRSEELEASSTARVNHLKEAWKNHTKASLKSIGDTEKKVSSTQRNGSSHDRSDRHASFWRQVTVLTKRTWTVTIRDPMGMFGSLIEAIAMGVIIGWIFLNLDGSQSGIRSRQGALYTASALQGYLVLLYETYRLTFDIQVFDRERGEGVVSVPAFLISRRIAKVLLEDLPVPLIFSLIFYFMAGFRTDGVQFMTFFAVIILEQYIAVCFGMVCVAVSRHFAGASLVANLAYTLQSVGCGYFIQSESIPVYTRWTKWLAYVFYAFGALCANEFVDHFYDCPEPGGKSNQACRPYTGAFIMDSLGFPLNWILRPMLALFAFVVGFYMLAACILQYRKREVTITRARMSDVDTSAGKEKMTLRSIEEVRAVRLRLDNYALDIKKREWWGGKKRTLHILQPLTADLQPGVLNVIMGPSGSGKTSLLNSMARRLKDDFTTKYKATGNILFNGAAAAPDVVQSICSFVTQDDDALLACLTVRETLRFAAGLRLPSFMTKEEKNRRAEEVLLKMGLKDCADNLIGNEMKKGISGGEKRRVTIAVQILTDPRVLFLDEPTSGLDAFTASSIIDVLRGLADEGRTLVLTIHQSRSDLFPTFGNILLLARGGHPVYVGPAQQMLPHFSQQGYDCPKTTNPADFALDLITIDLQHADREVASRLKVRNLIESWTSDRFSRAITNSHIASPAELGSLKKNMAGFRTALPILLHRAIINFRRQPDWMLARTMQTTGLAIVLALYFAPLKNDYVSIQNRFGFIQEVAPLYFVGMLQNVAIYPFEKDVFYREHDDLAYSVEAFFAQYTLIEIPFGIIAALLFAILGDLAIGLPRTAQMFFVMAYNAFCVVSCGESIGIMFITFFAHTGFAVNLTSVILSVAQIMGGVMSLNIPSFLQALNHLSPIKYSIASIAPYAMGGQRFTCTDYQRLPDGRCPIETGEQALQLYNLDVDPKINLLAVGLCAIIYRLLAYALLKISRERWIGRLWKKARSSE